MEFLKCYVDKGTGTPVENAKGNANPVARVFRWFQSKRENRRGGMDTFAYFIIRC